MTSQTREVRKREISFAERTKTRIWQELPSEENPYLARQCLCHGYDLLELAEKRSFIDVLFLLFKGELPTLKQARLLETLLIAMINPGPRHPAVRAAMNAGVGKTNPCHILPIGLSLLGGAHLGGEEVVGAMEFLMKNQAALPEAVAADLLSGLRPEQGDWHVAPGFGSRFGSVDPMPQQIAEILTDHGDNGRFLQWGTEVVTHLLPHRMGWLSTGIAAAVFCDLGFSVRTGGGLYQLFSAPGLLAHGLELANQSVTAMPFLDEAHYVIEPPARKG